MGNVTWFVYVAGFDLIHTNSYNQIVVSAASLSDFKDHGC